MAALHVGNLSLDITEEILRKKFENYGWIITRILLCRDEVKRCSHAFVSFQSLEAAQEALEELNFQDLMDRPMRITFQQTEEERRNFTKNNIFIKNLEPSIDDATLFDTFSAIGKVLSCKVTTDENGKSLGYGYVQFETEENAEKAIQLVNGKLLNNVKVSVSKFIPFKERVKQLEDKPFNNVYIKNFGDDTTEESLCEMFKEYGTITSCKVEKTKYGNKNKGFGFVAFEDPMAAKKACEELNGKVIDDKTLYVGRAESKAFRQRQLMTKFKEENFRNKYNNLYVKNLEKSIDSERLKREFEIFGEIKSAKVMTDELTGKSKGFGFVCFTNPSDAVNAIVGMHGRFLLSKTLYVSFAQNKTERQAMLKNQFTAQGLQNLQNVPVPGNRAGFSLAQPTPMPLSPYRPFTMQTQQPWMPHTMKPLPVPFLPLNCDGQGSAPPMTYMAAPGNRRQPHCSYNMQYLRPQGQRSLQHPVQLPAKPPTLASNGQQKAVCIPSPDPTATNAVLP